MSGDKVKKRMVYVLSKKVPHEVYDVYVGSTTKPIKERLSTHKDCSLRACNEKNKLYTRMRQVGLENWKIVPIFVKTCSKEEILKVEKKFIQVLDANLNTNSPFPNDADYEKRIRAIGHICFKNSEKKR